MMLAMAEQMPMTEVSKLMEVFDTQLWRVVRHYVEQAREETTAEDIHRVGIDETASSRGHKYVSVFVDMDTRRVVYATPGRDASTVNSFVEDLVAHDGLPSQIESVCCDMSPAFIQGISKSLPDAGITFDRFHVMQLAGAAVDAVRREERKTNAALKKTRYVWLRNPSYLNRTEQEVLESLSKQGLKTARAYHLRMILRGLWDQKPTDAHQYLDRWYRWAIRCRLAPMVALARTVRNHWDCILRYIETRLTNGVVEGINSKIQLARTRARGFRSTRNFITMIYLVAGKLRFDLPT
jgi:transposase